MKSKFATDLETSENFARDLTANMSAQQTTKTAARRGSMAPKIVVCPPVEELSAPVAEQRGSRILKLLSKRLSRRSTDADSVASSSSNDSMSYENGKNEENSCSTSDSGSDGSEPRRRHRSSVSLRRIFRSLNLTNRSQSSSPVDRQRPPKKQPQPKRILRSPVTYTYVCGLSGLPTQRVPRNTVGCASPGLNR